MADEQASQQSPVVDTQVADKPVADKPVADKPVSDKPVADKPISDKPVINRPATDRPRENRPPRESRPGGNNPPRAGGGTGGGSGGERREGGPPRSDRQGDRGPGGDRGRGDDRRGGGDRPRFDSPPEIDLEKLIADSLYLDNQAHAVVSRMRDMDSGTKSQLRRFYNAVRRACRTPENERQHEFVMLRARLAYTIARHSLRSLDMLEKLLLQVTRKNEPRGYERFRDLFEAIVAYNE